MTGPRTRPDRLGPVAATFGLASPSPALGLPPSLHGPPARVGGTPHHLRYQCVLQASFNLVEGPLAVAGLGAVPVDHEPDNRPQPLNQLDPNLILDAPGRREVQFGLHSSVGAVGMLTTGPP